MIIDPNNEKSLARLREKFIEWKKKGTLIQVTEIKDIHSTRQRNSLFLWLGWIAEEMNEMGYVPCIKIKHKEAFVKFDVPMPNTKQNLYDNIFREISRTLTGKSSVRKLSKDEFSQVVGWMGELFAGFGVVVDFPDKDKLIEP